MTQRKKSLYQVLLSLLLSLSVFFNSSSWVDQPQGSSAHASTPERFFLPLGLELTWLTDLMNLIEYLGEHAHLEPWHSLHPPLSIGESNKGRLLFGHKIQTAFGLWVMEPEDSYTSYEVALTRMQSMP